MIHDDLLYPVTFPTSFSPGNISRFQALHGPQLHLRQLSGFAAGEALSPLVVPVAAVAWQVDEAEIPFPLLATEVQLRDKGTF